MCPLIPRMVGCGNLRSVQRRLLARSGLFQEPRCKSAFGGQSGHIAKPNRTSTHDPQRISTPEFCGRNAAVAIEYQNIRRSPPMTVNNCGVCDVWNCRHAAFNRNNYRSTLFIHQDMASQPSRFPRLSIWQRQLSSPSDARQPAFPRPHKWKYQQSRKDS